jgi:hypothetical protein
MSSRVSDRSRGLETGTGLETAAVGLVTGAGLETGAVELVTGAGGLETEAEETEKREEIAKLTFGRADHSSITWSSTAEDSVGVVGTLSRAVLYGVGSDVGSVGSGSGT